MSPLSHIPRPEAYAALLSLGVSALLLAIKFVAYYLTGSAAVFSDAMESIVNVLASAVACYAIYLAHRPADLDHPYGHGKVEFLSAGFEGGMILLAAVVIVIKTADLLLFRTLRVERIDSGLLLLVAAMAVNGGVGTYLVRTGRRQRSLALEADGRHLLSDTVTTAGALAALGVVHWTGWAYADPLAALLLAGYIAWTGLQLVRRSAHGLMDAQDVEDERLLVSILDGHVGPAAREPRVCSYHKLRHRHSGRYHWVDFHLVVPGDLTVAQGHQIAAAIEHEIQSALGEGNATAHVEPCASLECGRCRR